MPAAQLRFTAPMSLRRRIEAALPAARPRASSRRSVLKGFAMGSALSAAMAATLVVAVIRTDQDQRVLGDALSAHVRSLQGEHLTDVQTSDQHTVKPWFNGKARRRTARRRPDSPRLQADRRAAGLHRRQGRRLHRLSAPDACDQSLHRAGSGLRNVSGAKIEKVQGFNIRRWNADGLEFWAVSDIDAEELQEFVEKFEAGLHEVGRT